MRSIIRRGFTAAAGVALAGIAVGMLPGTAQADDAVVSQATRTAKYSAYLAMKAAQGDEQAKETAKGFSALSDAQKSRFLDLLEDRSLMDKFFEQAEAPAVTTGKTLAVLAGGDVVVERESVGGADDSSTNTDAVMRASGYRDMWASYAVTDKFLGVKVARVSVRTNYQVKGKDTTKVYPGSASHYL